MNRGDVYVYKGLGRAEHAVVVSNDGFNAVTGQPLVVKVSDRSDLTETPYVVALGANEPLSGHLESYSVVRVRRDRLGDKPIGRLTAETRRKLDAALALLFDYET